MRRYAWLREPMKRENGSCIYKIMLYGDEGGFYLFAYNSPDAVICSSDQWYDSLDDLYDDWNDLTDESGWIDMDDPLPGCQHDAFIPLKVKGRDSGRPEWGRFEMLWNGEWVEYEP